MTLKAVPNVSPIRLAGAEVLGRKEGEGPGDPALVGPATTARPTLEDSYLCGDCVDIAFGISKKRHAGVEVATYLSESGAHQLIKYCVLMEAQLGAPLGSGHVEAVLAVYEIDAQIREFAARYGVRCAEVPLC